MQPAHPTRPEFLALRSEEAQQLEKQREWVRGHFSENADTKYEDLRGKLDLIQTILDQGWVSPTETWKLQSLGVTFGDALAQRLGLEWMIVIDEYGRAPTLRDSQADLNVNAVTMISKRVEAGEAVDVRTLFVQACDGIDEVRGKARRHSH